MAHAFTLLGTTPFPVDVWIDAQGRTRRVTVTLAAAQLGGPSATNEPSQVSVTDEFYDFGTAVSVAAPPADQVADFSDLLGGLGQNLGSLNGSSN